MVKFVVVWYILANEVPVFSGPMDRNEALMVYHNGTQVITSMPHIKKYNATRHLRTTQ